MDPSNQGAGEDLRTQCPNCGRTICGDTLKGLIKRVKAHSCNGPPSGRYSVQSHEDRFVPLILPVEFRFDRLVLSQNKTTYSHWTTYSRDKTSWKNKVHPYFNPISNIRLAWSRWHLLRKYSGRHRELDFANMVGGAKPLIDMLVTYHVIKDDNPSCFECTYSQERVEHENCTILTLLEIRDARYSTVNV